jgi:hypothetical protein
MHVRFRHYISLSVVMTLFVNTYGKGADSWRKNSLKTPKG